MVATAPPSAPMGHLEVFHGRDGDVIAGGFSFLRLDVKVTSLDGIAVYDGELAAAGLRIALPVGRHVVTAQYRRMSDAGGVDATFPACERIVDVSRDASVSVVTTPRSDGCEIDEGIAPWSVEVRAPGAASDARAPWWYRLSGSRSPKARVWHAMPASIESVYLASGRRRARKPDDVLSIAVGEGGPSTPLAIQRCGMEFVPCDEFDRAPLCTIDVPWGRLRELGGTQSDDVAPMVIECRPEP